MNRIALMLVVTAVALTFATLGQKSLWLDEALSVWSANRPVHEIWNTTNDPHPPLFYVVLHAWPWRNAGDAQARLPSALASSAALVLTFFVSFRLWRDTGRAALVTVLCAWAPLHVWYAQEIRMYAFLEAAGLLMALGLLLRSARGFAVFAAAFALALYIDYSAVVVWVALSGLWLGWWLVSDRQLFSFVCWLVSSVAGALLAWPVRDGLAALIEGRISAELPARVSAWLGSHPTPAFDAFVLLAMLLSITAITSLVILRRGDRLMWLAVAAFAGVTVISATIPRFYTVKKIIAPIWPLATIAVVGLATAAGGTGRTALKLLAGLSIGLTLWMLAEMPKDDWRGVSRYLEQHARAGGDVVWLDPPYDAFPFDYYKPGMQASSGGSVPLERAATGSGLLWLVVQRRPGSMRPGSSSEAWLDANRPLAHVVSFARLETRAYRRENRP